jgi:transposase
MLRIRTVKTASGARAVQVIYYLDRKRVIYKHIGSGKTDAEVDSLITVAQDFIDNYSPELPFREEKQFNNLLFLDKAKFLGVDYSFLHEVLSEVMTKVGLSRIKNQLLQDLVVMRIFEPCSKLRSIELLDTYFGIKHRRQAFYSSARNWLSLKEKVEKLVIEFVKKTYSFDFQILFYDVTTLYFETFEPDDLRKPGFSKDNKSQQPQILIGLTVTSDGFPVDYEVFAGNTFEGHTIIPFVKSLIKKHKIEKLTVVADAAMNSNANIEEHS